MLKFILEFVNAAAYYSIYVVFLVGMAVASSFNHFYVHENIYGPKLNMDKADLQMIFQTERGKKIQNELGDFAAKAAWDNLFIKE